MGAPRQELLELSVILIADLPCTAHKFDLPAEASIFFGFEARTALLPSFGGRPGVVELFETAAPK